MMAACRGNAPSWLALEMYHLGELQPETSRRVQDHLAECGVCRDCLNQIQREEAETLRPLPVIEIEPKRSRWLGVAWVTAAASLVAAAVMTIVLLTGSPVRKTGIAPPNRIAYKGGELAISLVRERRGVILHDPKKFAPGDRFKVLATCPPGETLHGDLLVIQDAEGSFPLAPSRALACGNRVPLAGAFELSGPSTAWICLLTAPRALDRENLQTELWEGLPAESVCARLDPQ